MAPFSTRKPAPAWPPFKESYQRLRDDEEIHLTAKSDLDTATSATSFFPTPTPRHATFASTNRRARWWHGWRGGVKVAFGGAALVLFLNVILIISMTVGHQRMNGMSMIYIGSCTTTERINTGVHLLVNVLSTALLAGSNYCMQILSAPTRQDIDKAHASGHWMDIGIASLRNLKMLRKQKVVLWWLLAFSSIPLHLFYNSVFFTAIATNDYNILYATADFVNGAPYNAQQFPDSTLINVTSLQSNAHTFQRLSNADCIAAYALDFVTDRKDVILVVEPNSTNVASSLLATKEEVQPPGSFNADEDFFSWICDDPATPARTNSSSGTLCSKMTPSLEKIANQEWRSDGFNISYCLSELREPDCHVHFAPQIMAPVIFFNVLKVIVIAYVSFFYKDKPIVTLGDAIESFCLQPDPTTAGMCLATHTIVETQWVKGYTPQPIRYDGQRRRWYQSATWKQWLTFGLVFSFAATGILISIGLGVQHSQPQTIAAAWSAGIGKVRTSNLITGLQITQLGPNAVFISALIANTPQTVFSFIYLIYNNVFTTMVLSNEWDRFSIKAGKGRVLRVSDPRGDQKSTYFLQIPYRYAIVMLSTSGLLHWLVSQSVFLANVAVIPRDGIRPVQDEIVSCAYSVQAMFFILVLGVLMLAWLVVNGWRKFSGGMPFVCSNSAAISAACHPEYGLRGERDTMLLKPLRWGVTDYGGRKSLRRTVSEADSILAEEPFQGGTPLMRMDTGYEDDSSFDGPVGHCTFTDGRVAKPVNGRRYA